MISRTLITLVLATVALGAPILGNGADTINGVQGAPNVAPSVGAIGGASTGPTVNVRAPQNPTVAPTVTPSGGAVTGPTVNARDPQNPNVAPTVAAAPNAAPNVAPVVNARAPQNPNVAPNVAPVINARAPQNPTVAPTVSPTGGAVSPTVNARADESLVSGERDLVNASGNNVSPDVKNIDASPNVAAVGSVSNIANNANTNVAAPVDNIKSTVGDVNVLAPLLGADGEDCGCDE